jgi:hypothetical protein
MPQFNIANQVPLGTLTHMLGHDVVGAFRRSVMATVAGTGLASDISNQLNKQTGTSYTVQISDNNKAIRCLNAATVILTFPPTLPEGFSCVVITWGAGLVKCVTTGSGVFRSSESPAHNGSRVQYSKFSVDVMDNIGGSAANFLIAGDTAVVA